MYVSTIVDQNDTFDLLNHSSSSESFRKKIDTIDTM